MPSDKPLINFVIEPELLEMIEHFRFQERFPSRAAAIKWLLRHALTMSRETLSTAVARDWAALRSTPRAARAAN